MVAKLSLVECMAAVEDPRVDRTKAHDLQDILVPVVLAVLCGADGWEDIELFADGTGDYVLARNRGRSPSDRVRVVVGEVDHDWDASELLIMRWLGRTGPKGISHSCMLGSLFDPVGMLQSLCLNRSLGKFFCCSLNQLPHHDRN